MKLADYHEDFIQSTVMYLQKYNNQCSLAEVQR